MIPLSVPNLSGNEWKYLKDCLDTNWVSSVGSFVDQFEEKVATYTGAKFAVSTMNGTSALQLSLLLVGVKSSDYVLVPNITFVASCNAIVHAGATPLLVDVNPETWQMDLELLETFLSENTILTDEGDCILASDRRRIKAVMPVHVLGNMTPMNELLRIAKKFKLEIVEDSTEALGSKLDGKHAGTFGRLGCLSFNGNKIITTGGGGMILTDDPGLASRAKHLTTQAKADGKEYFHDENGFNFRLVNVLAAMGVAQMEQLEGFLKRKSEIDSFYKSSFNTLEVNFQQIPGNLEPNFWLFTMGVSNKKGLIDHLESKGIQARPFWVPMNMLPMHSQLNYVNKADNSLKIYETCVSLPSSTGITDDELDQVSKAVKEFLQ